MDSQDAVLMDAMDLLREWEKEFWMHPGEKVRSPDVVELEQRLNRLQAKANPND